MVTGITTAIDREWHRLEAFDANRRLAAAPATIGDVIAMDFDALTYPSKGPGQINWHRLDERRVRRGQTPVDLAAVLREAPVLASGAEVMEWCPIRRTLQYAVEFLRARGKAVDLDEPVAGVESPSQIHLLKQAQEQFDKLVGKWAWIDTFGYVWDDYLENWGEFVHLPVWEADADWSLAPVLALVESVRDCMHVTAYDLDWAEGVYQLSQVKHPQPVQITTAGSIVVSDKRLTAAHATYKGVEMRELARRLQLAVKTGKRLRTLGKGWVKMVRFLATYTGTIYVDDYGDLGEVDLEWFDGFTGLAEEVSMIRRLRRMTAPVVNACCSDGENWWYRLLDTLLTFPPSEGKT